MNSLAGKYLNPPHSRRRRCNNTPNQSGDLFVASVINQKIVNQSAQQVLVAVAAQVNFIIEAQFGFSTNEDNDQILT
ncbi:hypothetical protein [Desulfitibacter alkalitolerans]|uniref:hypothetical protein n=1 Tax=Desulfitibacter alkalitolerans TaxID=264641 RepID=UPI00054F6DEA|nr:hypothetical protein [Desulfitibacter alkalitolerans]